MSMSDCFQYGKLRPVTNVNDLTSFLTLQQFGKQVLGEDFLNSVLWRMWSDSVPTDQPELREHLNTVDNMCYDESFKKDVHARLFSEESDNKGQKESFIIYDLTPNVCGVVINPGFFIEPVDTKLQIALIEAILKVLYVYDAYHVVASSPLFKRYLDLLSGTC
jgi:hypothetical protein